MTARPRLVLHVGQHKTGTTSIQQFLTDHRRGLWAAGLWYPRAGMVGWQHAQLPASYMGGHPHVDDDVSHVDPRTARDAILRDRRRWSTMVLSSEIWVELLAQSPHTFDTAIDSLSQFFDVIPLIFVRDPQSKSWSGLKHLARVGPPMDAGAVLATDIARDQAALVHLTTAHPRTIVTEYDKGDAVVQFLEVVRPLAYGPKATQRLRGKPKATQRLRGKALDRLITNRRSTQQRRLNTDLSHPKAAALTIATSQSLWDARSFTTERPPDLSNLFRKILQELGNATELQSLPDEATVRQSVTGSSSTTLGDLLSPEQTRSLAHFWGRPDVAERCTVADATAYRASVLAALQAHLDAPVAGS